MHTAGQWIFVTDNLSRGERLLPETLGFQVLSLRQKTFYLTDINNKIIGVWSQTLLETLLRLRLPASLFRDVFGQAELAPTPATI